MPILSYDPEIDNLADKGDVKAKAISDLYQFISSGQQDESNLAFKSIGTTQLKDDSVTAAKIETQESYIAPTLLNSWVNYNATLSQAGYMKDSLGFVHLRGVIKDGTVNNTAFTLPAGYRPAYQNVFVVDSNAAHGRVDIKTDGTVHINLICSNTYVSLDGIVFKAA